jgi:hypothetical protein
MIKVQIKPLPNSPALESVTDARTRTELMKVNENVKSVKGQLSECQRAVQELQQSGGSSSKVIVTPEMPEQPEVPDVDLEALNILVSRAETAAKESILSATSAADSAEAANNNAINAKESSESAEEAATKAEEAVTKAEEAATKAEEAAASIVGGFRGPIVISAMGNMNLGTFSMSDWGADPNKTYNVKLFVASTAQSSVAGSVRFSAAGLNVSCNWNGKSSTTGTIKGDATFSVKCEYSGTPSYVCYGGGTLIITE